MATVKVSEQQKEWMVKIAVGAVAVAVCFVIIIHPVFSRIAILNRKNVDFRERVELFDECKGLRASLNSFEKGMANLTDRSLLLGQLSAIAGQADLDIDVMTPRTEPDGNYTRLKIETEGKGSFFSLLTFVEAVEKIGDMIRIKDVSLMGKNSDSSSAKKNLLQIHLVFETFLKSTSSKNKGKRKNV